MNASFLSDKSIFKALISSSVAAAIDILIYKNNNTKGTMILAGTVGASSYISSKASNFLPDVTGTTFDNQYMDSKTVEQRILELSLSSGGSFVISKYVLKNMRDLPLIQYVGIFGGASFASEYITDYVFSQPLSYLS